MENAHMFDELTNRLHKVKRPDSGIHNSGEFTGDNEKSEKGEELVDSGRDSDPADAASPPKRGGIFKNIKKMFKMKPKKGERVTNGEDSLSGQYKAVSEPHVNTTMEEGEESLAKRCYTTMDNKSPNSPNLNDYASDDEDEKVDEKKNSLKDGPSFIRTSLRKLKLRMKKSNGSDSSPGVVTKSIKKHDSPGMSSLPKKSPIPIPRKRDEDVMSDFRSETEELSTTPHLKVVESTISTTVTTQLESEAPLTGPVIQTSAAKDKIRIAPRNRRLPTRTRHRADVLSPSVTSSDRKSSASSVRTIGDDDTFTNSADVKNGIKAAISSETTENKFAVHVSKENIHEIDGETLNSEVRAHSLSSKDFKAYGKDIAERDALTAKIVSQLNSSSKSLTTSDPQMLKSVSDDGAPNISSGVKNTFANPKPIPKKKPVLNPANRNNSVETRDVRSLSLSLGDLLDSSSDAPAARRSKSLKIMSEEINNISNETTFAITGKDDDNHRYDKFRRYRQEHNPDVHPSKLAQRNFSKSTNDVSKLNKENNRRSALLEDVSPTSKRAFHDTKRHSVAENIDFPRSRENLGKSVESKNGFGETTFAVTSQKSPVIPFGDNGYTVNSASKFHRKSVTEIKDDLIEKANVSPNRTNRKIRPLSEKISSSEADLIFTNISFAKSSDDLRVSDVTKVEKIKPLSPIQKVNKPVVNGKKQASIESNCSEENNLPEFNRVSLRKISKAEEYVEKEIMSSSKESVGACEEEHTPFKSMRRSLRKVERKDDDVMSEKNSIAPITDNVTSENNSIAPITDNIVRVKKISIEKELRKPIPSLPVKDKTTHPILTDSNVSPSAPEVTPEVKAEFTKVPLKYIGKAKSEQNDFVPFHIQDVRSDKVPLAEVHRKSPFSLSVDVEEKERGVPAWIAMAQRKQRENEVAMADRSATESDQTSSKPPITKPKPKLLPKPDISRVASPPTPPKGIKSLPPMQLSHQQSNVQSPPTSPEQPTFTGKRHSLRFNAKTDLSQDTCIVCGKTAYIFERCEVNKRTIHRACLKCSACSRTLNLNDIFITDNKVFCHQHR